MKLESESHDQQSSYYSITPPLESDYSCLDSLNSLDNYPLVIEPQAIIRERLISNLPDSPDSLTSTNKKFKNQKNQDQSFDSTKLTTSINNIATNSQLRNSNHRFHPFNQNGTNIDGSSIYQSSSPLNSSSIHQDHLNNFTQFNQQSSSHSNRDHSSIQHNQNQMPETDCYISSATTNMLDYHLNSAYIGDLSSAKCSDYQVNGYASSYYPKLVKIFIFMINLIII